MRACRWQLPPRFVSTPQTTQGVGAIACVRRGAGKRGLRMGAFEDIDLSQFDRADVDPDMLLRITLAWEHVEELREVDAPEFLLEDAQRLLERHVTALAVWYRARMFPR